MLCSFRLADGSAVKAPVVATKSVMDRLRELKSRTSDLVHAPPAEHPPSIPVPNTKGKAPVVATKSVAEKLRDNLKTRTSQLAQAPREADPFSTSVPNKCKLGIKETLSNRRCPD